jgi:2'-5' RNA ligase
LNSSVRLFVAVNLPAAERQRLFEETSPLRTGRFPVRWVLPESMHVTLSFLGRVAEEMVSPIREALERATGRYERLVMKVGGVGAFPNLRRPRVLWIGAHGGQTMLDAQADVVHELEPLGFEPEKRAWSPHLTLGRAEKNARATSFNGIAAIATAVMYETEVEVETIDLMRSHLGRGGARYEMIAAAALRRGSPDPGKTQEAAE